MLRIREIRIATAFGLAMTAYFKLVLLSPSLQRSPFVDTKQIHTQLLHFLLDRLFHFLFL